MLLAGKTGFTKGINKFSDWTEQEYRMMLGYRPDLFHGKKVFTVLPEDSNAASVDWRTKGAVTPVKNQQ